jgi:hypothetical protein
MTVEHGLLVARESSTAMTIKYRAREKKTKEVRVH